jgi:hypothetical protein
MFIQFILAYFSPETLLPATSIVATIAGVVLMCGRSGLRLLVRSGIRVFRRPAEFSSVQPPHFRFTDRAHSQSPGHRRHLAGLELANLDEEEDAR